MEKPDAGLAIMERKKISKLHILVHPGGRIRRGRS